MVGICYLQVVVVLVRVVKEIDRLHLLYVLVRNFEAHIHDSVQVGKPSGTVLGEVGQPQGMPELVQRDAVDIYI